MSIASPSRPRARPAPHPQPHLRLWRAYVAVGALAVTAHALIPPGTLHDLQYLTIVGYGVLGVVVGVRVHRPRHSRAWWLIAGGLCAWFAGTACYLVGAPSVAFWGFWVLLAGYPVIALGLLGLARARTPHGDRAGSVDAGTLVVGLGLVTFVLLVEPWLGSAGGMGVAAQEAAFSTGGILLLAGLVRITTTPHSWSRSAGILALALGLKLCADLMRQGFAIYGSGQPEWLDLIWLTAWLCWGGAALHPSMTGVTEPIPRSRASYGWTRTLVAGGAAALAPLILAVEQLQGLPLSVWPVVVGSLAMVTLILLRVRIAVDEIHAASAEAVELQDQLAFEATHDALTLLPNRAYGLKLLEAALERARVSGGVVTVMFLDLDGFKQVNDVLGHRAGDQLLRRVAERLTRSVRNRDVAVRLGGDEFLLVLETVDEATTAHQVADRIIEAVSRPLHLGPQGSARVGVSIGIVQCTGGAEDPATLIHEADLAAYSAKQGGKGRAELFDVGMRTRLAAQDRLAAELRRAMAREELVLHYQPVIDSFTGEVRGYEALVRWQHPERGLLPPGDFLPVAESAGLAGDLDRQVLHRATAQLQEWVTRDGFDRLVIAVNISPTSVARSQLVNDVREALEASGLRPDRLVLELPEKVLMDTERSVAHLRAIRELGVGVSIVDFGAGVGALAALATQPVNVVKIARSALGLATPLDDRLLRLMIQGAHAVGLSAVAEGVERDDQLATLRSMRCDMVQGYHIAHPMPAEEVALYHQQQWGDRFIHLLRST